MARPEIARQRYSHTAIRRDSQAEWLKGRKAERLNSRRKRKSGGFTLLELIVSIVIFSIMAAAIYGIFRSGLDAYKYGRETLQEAELGQALLRLIEDDLRGAYISYATAGGPSSFAFIGEDLEMDLLSTDRLQFISVSNFPSPEALGEADLVEVEYHMQGEECGLYRERRAVLLATEEPEEEISPLAPEVRSLNFRYYDGDEWVDDWDSITSERLPLAVEVTLSISSEETSAGDFDEEEEIRTFSTVVALPLGRRIEELE